MKQTNTKLYEGMYILSAQLTDDTRTKAFNKVKDAIISRGGEIHKIHDQGRRRLTYEINRQKEGYYFLVYFSIEPRHIPELWQEYQHNENLIRYLTLRTDAVLEELKFKQLPEQ